MKRSPSASPSSGSRSISQPGSSSIDIDTLARHYRSAQVSDRLLKLLVKEDSCSGQLLEEAHDYVPYLTSYSLQRLRQEPVTLELSKDRITREMESLAVSNYSCFIDSGKAVHTIRTEMVEIDHQLERLGQSIDPLVDSCAKFQREAEAIAKERNNVRLTLMQHSNLLEILEIPQLVDTCIRNSFYEEALDLDTYCQSLAKRHPNIRVVQDVVNEVGGLKQQLLQSLLDMLKTNIPLTGCLRIVSFLRRLGAYSEVELAMKFLQNRDQWLRSSFDDIPNTNDSSVYVQKYVDVLRTHIFDIVTQYQAIFVDDDEDRGGTILFAWIVEKSYDLLHQLSIHLPRIQDGSSLSNALEQCMYCGHSLARVGADLRPLLVPLYEKTVIDLFARHLDGAIGKFSDLLKKHKWIAPHSSLLNALGAGSAGRSDTLSPPSVLLDHAPLAQLTNMIVNGFKDLSTCAPVSLASECQFMVNFMLNQIAEELHSFHKQSALKPDEQKLFEALCRAAVESFIPFVCRCFDVVFAVKGHQGSTSIDQTHLLRRIKELYVTPEEAAAVHASTTTVHSPPADSAVAAENPVATNDISVANHQDEAATHDSTVATENPVSVPVPTSGTTVVEPDAVTMDTAMVNHEAATSDSTAAAEDPSTTSDLAVVIHDEAATNHTSVGERSEAATI
eukprot:GILJ01008128.1.p1 GENE.GILJ01008128.1~~GILJ01008128.1.p1  ORF type:complete len:673 (+),score=105.28 GILJ01008128.1:31-2049(+)